MGYCIEMTDSNFVVKKENFVKALESLKGVFIPENMTCYDSIGGTRFPHFKWVDTKSVLDSNTLIEAMEEIRYLPIQNLDEDICDVEFIGEKYGDESIFFKALAPYVESGSYICFIGEDDSEWKWVFDKGEVEYVEV